MAKQVAHDKSIDSPQTMDYRFVPDDILDISPDLSDNEDSEDEFLDSVTSDCNDHCYSKGMLPPAPPIPASDPLKFQEAEGGFRSRGKTAESNKKLPRSNQGDFMRSLGTALDKIRLGKRPDSVASTISISNFRDSAMISDYRPSHK